MHKKMPGASAPGQSNKRRVDESDCGATSLDEPDQQYDHGDDQENVDEAAQRIGADNSKQPQHQKNYKDCPKHVISP